MAQLKAAPRNFASALEVLGGKQSIRLGNNTYLEQAHVGFGKAYIGVRLHSTYIVRFYKDGAVTLHTGGYRTVTTKERINQFILGRVYQKAHEWFFVVNRGELGFDWANPVPFEEGMDVGWATSL